ncbi:Lactate dehydrogenase [Sphingobium sp. AP50]|uniref:2-hydroxyacid dehydrogenase n=1 Tax=Sphingobium sp. AP50 TaxID=1884369 RepID=UPI0008C28214|nr:D-glycerate dehydrogenase [Sphingobium sp. AP50]SEJ95314.1 Lactate dehydrogenase [Sphingobium sp. AP50]
MEPQKILVTRLWPQPVLDAMRQRYDVTIDATDQPLTRSDLAEALMRFDILCPTITDRIDAEMLRQSGLSARLIANFGAGCDHIALAAARQAGIMVTNTPDVLTHSTAELAIMLMLMAARRAGEGERQLRAGNWPGWHPVHLMGVSLQGKRLGLIGYGRIAQVTARLARSLWDMEVAYHARRPVMSEDAPPALFVPDLTDLLATCDVVSIHCPGGPETHHLLDADRLALMKPSALLINTARGTVIDEVALVAALQAGRPAAAGLDVYEREPLLSADLASLENAVLLPHLGSATIETRCAMGFQTLANIDAFVAGKEPPDRVA